MVDAVLQRVLATRPSIAQLWHAVRELPGGPAVFSRFISQLSPHTASLGARVRCLEEGLVEIVMRDRRSQYDMNGSVHAAVLTNLAEMTSGLAIRYVVDRRGEARLSRISLEIVASAVGEVHATCEDLIPRGVGQHAPTLRVCLRDTNGVVVANATTLWNIRVSGSG